MPDKHTLLKELEGLGLSRPPQGSDPAAQPGRHAELDALMPEKTITVTDEDLARLELIRDHDGNDLSENDTALLTRLIEAPLALASTSVGESPVPASPQKDGGEGRRVEIRSSSWNSDGELTGLGVDTPEESVDLLPEVIVIGLREELALAKAASPVPASPSEEGLGDDPLAKLRPASRAHVALVAAVLQCIETGVEPDTIRRFVDEELPGAQPASPSPVEGQGDVWTGPADIAWCPEHGLHGSRDTCFECGKPVKQIRMIPLAEVGPQTHDNPDPFIAEHCTCSTCQPPAPVVGEAPGREGR